MKAKKIATMLLSGVLALSMAAPVFGTSAGVGSGEGETNYVPTEIFDVTLSTTQTLDFLLDPQGLSNLADGDSIAIGDIEGGLILPRSRAAIALNHSSMDVLLTAAFTAEFYDATSDGVFITAAADIAAARTAVNVATATPNNVMLYVVPSRDSMTTVNDHFVPAEIAFPLDDTARTLTFILDAAEYSITNNAGVFTLEQVEGTSTGTQFQVGGLLNHHASWADFAAGTDNIELDIVFNMTSTITTAQEAYPAIAAADFLRAAAANQPTSLTLDRAALGIVETAGFITGTGATERLRRVIAPVSSTVAQANAGLGIHIPFTGGGFDVTAVSANFEGDFFLGAADWLYWSVEDAEDLDDPAFPAGVFFSFPFAGDWEITIWVETAIAGQFSQFTFEYTVNP
ncbi:MAG: hypothetical protein FWE05_02330 [Defluviitaleaceae bacterium]|nr:hypothetical protein [Defluviitaleaceae bacterium]